MTRGDFSLKPLSDRRHARGIETAALVSSCARARHLRVCRARVLPLTYAKGRRRGEPQGNRRDEGVIVNVTHAEAAARHMGRYASVTSTSARAGCQK